MSKYHEVSEQLYLLGVRTVELHEYVATAVENAVKAALTDDSLLPHYSSAIHEARLAKCPPDVIASLYAKEQGFKP
jgi:hypothetical protein